MLLTTDILRLRCDVDSKEAPSPVSGGAMLAWLGRDLTFELGIFLRGAWVAPTNWTSLTIQILPANTQESKLAPTGTPTPLAVVTVSSFDATGDAVAWAAGTKQQATVTFTAAQLNFSLPGAYAWLVVNLTLDTGQLVTPAAGPIELRPTGSAAPEAAPPDAAELLAYTKTEADARYLPIFGTGYRRRDGYLQLYDAVGGTWHPLFISGGALVIGPADLT